MLLSCPEEFRVFLQEHGRIYPYRDCLKTRRRMHVKWLLMEKRQPTVGGEDTKWTILHSNTFDNDTVTHLIVSMQALPVPPTVSEVLDGIQSWGKSLDPEWCNCATDYMGYLCWNGFELQSEDIFFHLIKMRIDLMLQRHASDLPFASIMEDWECYYKWSFHYKGRVFADLCLSSFEYVKSILEELDNLIRLMNTPVVVPVTPPSIVSS